MTAPRVDFYVLAGDDPGARLRFACRLIEKAWLMRNRIRVQFDPGGDIAAFDQLLWTFSDRSFVPHRRAGEQETVPSSALPPVVLADTADADASDGGLVVNLGTGVPAGFEGFERVAEVIDSEAGRRQLGRERFRFYRERGISPATHEMRSES